MSELPRVSDRELSARARECAHEVLDDVLDLYLAGAELPIRGELMFVATQSDDALLRVLIGEVLP